MEFKAQVKKILPLIMLIDTSSSMFGCMDELNTSTREMIETLKRQESLRAEIHISFITFGKDGARLQTPLTPVSSIEFEDFIEGGMTPLGGALRIAKEMVEDRNIVPSNSYRPTVIMLSDGGPNDVWEEPFRSFIEEGRSKKCERMSLGIGQGYIYKILEKFSSNGKVFEAKDASNIVDFFKFVTMTMKEKSISSNPNKSTVDPSKFMDEVFGAGEKIVRDKNEDSKEDVFSFSDENEGIKEYFNL